MEHIVQSSDNGSVSINGDGNSVVVNSVSQVPVGRSLLFSLCKSLVEYTQNNPDKNDDGTINIAELPMKIKEKIDYNDLREFKGIFEAVCINEARLDEVLSAFYDQTDRTYIITSVITSFSKYKYQENISNDERLRKTCSDLQEKVMKSSSAIIELEIEHVEQGIYVIVYYVFTLCQILEKI